MYRLYTILNHLNTIHKHQTSLIHIHNFSRMLSKMAEKYIRKFHPHIRTREGMPFDVCVNIKLIFKIIINENYHFNSVLCIHKNIYNHLSVNCEKKNLNLLNIFFLILIRVFCALTSALILSVNFHQLNFVFCENLEFS